MMEIFKDDPSTHIPRFLQVLHYLLAQYCNYNKIDLEKGIDLVVFEKMATFTHRFTTEYTKTVKSKDINSGFNFNSLQIVKSKHGRRVSRKTIKHRIFLPEIIETFDRNNLNKFLRIIKSDESREISDPYNRVRMVDPSPPKEIDFRFNEQQRDFISTLSYSLEKLNEEELRAIGTHTNAKDAVEDIEKEFSDVLFHSTKAGSMKIIDQCIDALKNNQNPSLIDAIKHLLSYMEEAYRKTIFNKNNYESAFQKLSYSLQIPFKEEFKQVFEKCQSIPKKIWNDELTNSEVYDKSKKAFGLSLVLRYCVQFVNNPKKIIKYNKLSLDKQKWHYKQSWEDAIKLYDNQRVGKYISSYIINNGFDTNAKKELVASLEGLKRWIMQNIPKAADKYNYG